MSLQSIFLNKNNCLLQRDSCRGLLKKFSVLKDDLESTLICIFKAITFKVECSKY